MFRGCPTTGRMSHRFDPATHRCVCGRWQAGFAPKKESVLPRADCQICERQQAIDAAGQLVHHGYKRPGCGWIEGDCMGVAHLPYPATDALEMYLVAVQGYVSRCRTALAKLPTLTSWEYTYDGYTAYTGSIAKKQTHTVTIRKGDEYRYDAVKRQTFPAFADLIQREAARLENEILFATADVERVEKRIAAARLMGVEVLA